MRGNDEVTELRPVAPLDACMNAFSLHYHHKSTISSSTLHLHQIVFSPTSLSRKHPHILATHSLSYHIASNTTTMPSKTKSSKAQPSSDPLDDLAAEPPTEEIDPYAVLSVARDATDDQIKKAYRKAALKHHPGKLVPFATPPTSAAPSPISLSLRTRTHTHADALTLLPPLQTKQQAPTPPQHTQTSSASPSPTPSSPRPPGAPTTTPPAPPPPHTSTQTTTPPSTGRPSSAPPTPRSPSPPSPPSAPHTRTRPRSAQTCFGNLKLRRGIWIGCMSA